MRLSSFHIDGFGALADVGLEEIGSGLVVILGPNEAGKSTLFDFISGALFGFPNRRNDARYHAPARGGRHGGRIRFVDEAGGTWTVERHAGAQRGFEVRLPDGSAGDEASLSRALAGASSSLFRAVFAVGLGDLGQMDHLESDEVRELLFAASIFGQRRSATKAMKHLAEARDCLARPRRDDATANRLAGELETVRAELTGARQDAASYGGLRQQAAHAEAEMAAMRTQLKALRNRERELQLLETCWRHYCDARRAGEALRVTPAIGSTGVLLEHGAELRRLTTELSGHLERAAKLDELRRNRASLDASVDRRLVILGSRWTREAVIEAPDPERLAEDVRSTRDRLNALQTDVASATAVLTQAEALRAACTDPDESIAPAFEREAPPRGDSTTATGRVPDRSELERLTGALAELRDRATEAERLELEVLADARAGDRHLSAPGPRHRSRPATLALAASGLVVVTLGATLLLRHQTSLGIVALVLGVALLLACGATWGIERRDERPATAQPAGAASDARDADRTDRLVRTRARVEELAGQLGLEVPPLRVDIERFGSALQRTCDARRRLDDEASVRAEAEARVARAAEAARGARLAMTLEQQEHAAWCERHGFDTAAPTETFEAITVLAELREQLAGRTRIDKAIDALAPSVASFGYRCRQLLAVVDPVELENAPSYDDDGLATALAKLMQGLDDATALDARRTAYSQELSNAESALEHALGGGEAAERIRAELANGDVLDWATEREDLEPSIEEFRHAEEEAVRNHQSVAEAMQRLATSDRIAELERRQDALEVELDGALRQYLVLGTARALLQATLARHERERQPAVVARAAAHFERVTGGRYTGLLASSGSDGKQTVRVLSRTGEAIDAANLSRGTIEQLYLCLRLGLADSFAERSVSLPIVLDDVLVNFDPDRAGAVASELVASAQSHQMLFLTCHPHLAEMMMRESAGSSTASQLIELGRREPDSQQAALPLLTALPPLSA